VLRREYWAELPEFSPSSLHIIKRPFCLGS